MHVDLIKLYGSMELAPLIGLADAIVDLVSTGSTLRANHLVEVEQIMHISARLVVNQAALKLKQRSDPPLIDAFAGAIDGKRWMLQLNLLDTRRAPTSRRSSPLLRWSSHTGREHRAAVGRRSWPTCGAAATRRCWSTPARFDGVPAERIAALELSRAELEAAFAGLAQAHREALVHAAGRIRATTSARLGESWSYVDDDGTRLGQKVTPLDRVGIYVPGGKAAYPSSVLMNAMPGQVAGVGEIVMVVPTPARRAQPAGAGGRRVCGVGRVFTIGGAQAIAALAYGTQTVPRVDKIIGPGNAYVATAKRRVFGAVGIDMIAGPCEILVLGDGSTNPDWVAMDLFSQAEHDELAQSILLCPDARFVQAVADSIERLLPEMPRREVIEASLRGRGALITVRDLEEACEISNRIAPEHLEISGRIRSAGSRCFATPARSSSAATPARRWATTAPVRTTCCPPPAPRASPRRWACTTSRSAPA